MSAEGFIGPCCNVPLLLGEVYPDKDLLTVGTCPECGKHFIKSAVDNGYFRAGQVVEVDKETDKYATYDDRCDV